MAYGEEAVHNQQSIAQQNEGRKKAVHAGCESTAGEHCTASLCNTKVHGRKIRVSVNGVNTGLNAGDFMSRSNAKSAPLLSARVYSCVAEAWSLDLATSVQGVGKILTSGLRVHHQDLQNLNLGECRVFSREKTGRN